MSEERISDELNYSIVKNNHSTTVFRKISPQGISTAIALSSSASVGSYDFILPPSVMNLSKSRLTFQLQLPVPVTTVNANWLNANLLTILSRVVIYDSATNALLMDVSNMEKYASLVSCSSTSFAEFSTKAQGSVAGNILGAVAATSQLYPYEDIGKVNATANPTGDNINLGTTNSYMGRKQLFVGADVAVAYIDVSIPFSAFKHTIMALNKDIYSPSNLVLQLYFNSTDNFAWNAKSITVPSTTVTSVNTGALINNLSIQLANEGNLAIVSQVISRVMGEGVSIPIAYPTVTRQAISASSAHSYQISLTKGYGQRILAILSAPFSAAAGVNLRNVHARDNLSTYQTTLNNSPIKYPNGFNCLVSEDYFYGNREYFEGSALQSIGEYISAEWLHCDSFVGEFPLHQLDQTKVDGLDVGTQSAVWQIQANLSTSTAYTWISCIVGQKVLTFSSSGTMIQ